MRVVCRNCQSIVEIDLDTTNLSNLSKALFFYERLCWTCQGQVLQYVPCAGHDIYLDENRIAEFDHDEPKAIAI